MSIYKIKIQGEKKACELRAGQWVLGHEAKSIEQKKKSYPCSGSIEAGTGWPILVVTTSYDANLFFH